MSEFGKETLAIQSQVVKIVNEIAKDFKEEYKKVKQPEPSDQVLDLKTMLLFSSFFNPMLLAEDLKLMEDIPEETLKKYHEKIKELLQNPQKQVKNTAFIRTIDAEVASDIVRHVMAKKLERLGSSTSVWNENFPLAPITEEEENAVKAHFANIVEFSRGKVQLSADRASDDRKIEFLNGAMKQYKLMQPTAIKTGSLVLNAAGVDVPASMLISGATVLAIGTGLALSKLGLELWRGFREQKNLKDMKDSLQERFQEEKFTSKTGEKIGEIGRELAAAPSYVDSGQQRQRLPQMNKEGIDFDGVCKLLLNSVEMVSSRLSKKPGAEKGSGASSSQIG